MNKLSMVWRFFGFVLVSVLLVACGGKDGGASNSSPIYYDIACPVGFLPSTNDPSSRYFCVQSEPALQFFEQNCSDESKVAGDSLLFCPQMWEVYCEETGEFDSCESANSDPCIGMDDVVNIDGRCVSTYCPPLNQHLHDPSTCPDNVSSSPITSSSSASSEWISVVDLLHCPEGYGTPPFDGTYSYYCLSRTPPNDYYLQNCGEANNDYFCPLLEDDYCPSTGVIVVDGGECPTSSSSSSSQQSNQELCGVDYDALGNGSWQACYVLQNGTAECLHKENPTQAVQVKWDDGSPVQNAAQISGAGYYEVILITEEGTVHYGSRDRLSKNPKISELGISATGGQNTRCAMVRENNKNDVRCWDGGSDAFRPQLPDDFNAQQLSANYSDVCALDDDGKVWCWEQKPDNSLDFISANPSIAPFSEEIKFVSVGQLQVCGVKASGGVECLARWDSTNYLPTKGGATNEPVTQNGMSDVIGLELGFDQGITIHEDGKAKFWKSGSPTEFTGVSNAIAAGGDRDLACVLTADGDVYCLNSSRQPVKVNGNQKARNSDCPLVF